jgi:hypothetical protein
MLLSEVLCRTSLNHSATDCAGACAAWWIRSDLFAAAI